MNRRILTLVSLCLVFFQAGVFPVYAVPDETPPAGQTMPETGIAGQIAEKPAPAEPVPDVFVPFDTARKTTVYAIVVEKETQTLMVYEYNGTPRRILEFKCSTGKNTGRKKISGDSKTPEGIYFFNKIHEDRELAPIYGIRAFTTDYPNFMDQQEGRTGSAIWLHGTNKILKDRDSNGCVVLENENLKKVEPYITLNQTPVIITDRLNFQDFEAGNTFRDGLTKLVAGWTAALEGGPYHDYISFYDSEYVPDISWWAEWNKTRRELRSEGRPVSIQAAEPVIFRYKDLFVALFDLSVQPGKQTVPVGTRKFFLKWQEDQFRIIGEDYQRLAVSVANHENPVIIAARTPAPRQPEIAKAEPAEPAESSPPPDMPDVEKLVNEWLAAWSDKDMDLYERYYAQDFRSQGMNLRAWVNYKKTLGQKYSYIKVTQRNLNVRRTGGQIVVSFVQNYESNAFKSVGLKKLILKPENGQWKIYRETSKRL